MDIGHHDTRCVFVWDKYGHHGLVGFAMVEPATATLRHFVFSCRIMHMGIEDFVLRKLAERYPALDLSCLRKDLPAARSETVTERPFSDPEVRARILAAEAPRDPAQIGLRIMCDCQSGGIAHFSRHRAAIEFDNLPRLFSLPMMLAGGHRGQFFPRCLVYSAATDYLDWRWTDATGAFDDHSYARCLEQFCRFVVENDHKLLVFLPPDNAADDKYHPIVPASQSFERRRALLLNPLWKAAAERHGANISCIDLSDMIGATDMIDANHYLPAFFPAWAAAIDAWYELQTGQ